MTIYNLVIHVPVEIDDEQALADFVLTPRGSWSADASREVQHAIRMLVEDGLAGQEGGPGLNRIGAVEVRATV